MTTTVQWAVRLVATVSLGIAPMCEPAKAQATASTQERALPADLPASARLAVPGAQHRWLDPLVGRWNVQMRVWAAPGAVPMESSQLTAVREWILGGRYLREELTGTFAGNLSQRLGLLGYNNLERRFELVTVDTFEPGQMSYASRDDGKPGAISLVGENTEAGFGPAPTGRKRTLRFDIDITGDVNVQRIHVRYPGEAEFLFVEQRFTKAL